MAKYKCIICNQINEIANIDDIETCPSCGMSKEYLELTEEIEEIPVIEGPIPISKDNPGIQRIEEKCIKCGLCASNCHFKAMWLML